MELPGRAKAQTSEDLQHADFYDRFLRFRARVT